MTKQIERAYRSTRRRSWVLIAAVVALAAVAIPIATGAPEKTYTLGFDTATPPTLAKTVCIGATTPVDVYLTNTAKTANLGSAQVTVPAGGKITAVTKNGSPIPNVTGVGTNMVTMSNVDLAKSMSARLTVDVSASASGVISAIVKQSNNFNDTATTANLFSNPTGTTNLTVQSCVATIKGQIWNDSNENQSKDTFEATQRPPKLSVVLKVLTDGAYVPTNIPPTYDLPAATSETPGYSGYTFSGVPTGKDYVVCEVAGTGTTETWKQTTGSPQGAVCGSALPNGWAIANLSGDVTQQDFGNANTVTITCPADGGSPDSETIENNDTRYTVKVSGSTCKNGVFVLEAYSPDATKRVANFHPVGTGISTKIELIEKMEWRFSGTDQPDPAGRSLKYDDDTTVATGGGLNPLPMPYCLRDPRTSEWVLGSTAGVLPTVGDVVATSCLLKTIEMTVTNPDATPKPFNREDWIYSSVDGYRLGP